MDFTFFVTECYLINTNQVFVSAIDRPINRLGTHRIMSSIITSLTPNQVNDELNKMQAFIRKEAEEKAKEIQLKADQEYEIEKTSIVRNETNNIDVNYEAKLKKLSLKQQITKSTIANKIRLKVLSAREQSLDQIFDEAKEKLASLAKNESTYKPILQASFNFGSTIKTIGAKGYNQSY